LLSGKSSPSPRSWLILAPLSVAAQQTSRRLSGVRRAMSPPGAPPPARPSRARFVFLTLAALLSFLLYLDRICISESGAAFAREFHLDKLLLGCVFSAFTVGYTLFEVPSGAWGDRVGPRRVLLRIVLCWSLFTVLTGCVGHFTLDSGRRVPW